MAKSLEELDATIATLRARLNQAASSPQTTEAGVVPALTARLNRLSVKQAKAAGAVPVVAVGEEVGVPTGGKGKHKGKAKFRQQGAGGKGKHAGKAKHQGVGAKHKGKFRQQGAGGKGKHKAKHQGVGGKHKGKHKA